ncbi:TetR/AcrR family transcriptional regulator [Shewanella sp. JM162201]|uniref:TetR/AcrR family transcriptional regulator n=1 Tax=Shewanella jiangmenensis TaxID=2837387 RepID=A0ABS5V6K6_9GAMM|nr:TetR-like C-terminal domain-containing protein [Shewanella jiangmenensis]MBT1446077.1 TetR/AcrR family transcriptional regulator [Shewanella jiangmenensis]
MARRKDHTHDEIREMAMAEVEAALEREPLSALSLRRVAAAVGYAPSTLIKVFGNFHYLLLAVAAKQLELLERQFANAASLPPKPALKAMVQAYGEFAIDRPGLFSLIFELRMPDEAPLPESHLELIARLLARVEACLAALLPRANAEEIHCHSRLLWAAIQGLVTLSLQDKLFFANQSISDLLIVQLENQINAIEARQHHHREVNP